MAAAVTARSADGATPLHWAAAFGHLTTTEFLVQTWGAERSAGAGPDQAFRPKDAAASQGHTNVASWLLAAG